MSQTIPDDGATTDTKWWERSENHTCDSYDDTSRCKACDVLADIAAQDAILDNGY